MTLSGITRWATPKRAAASLATGLLVAALTTDVIASRSVDQSLHFRVLRGDSPIGEHMIDRRTVNGDTVVEVSIDLKVKVLFMTVFAYEHRNREVWRDGRLVSLDSRTNDDGEKLWVKAARSDDGIRVVGSGGSFTAPADVMTTSYWNSETVQRSQLLDTQHGKLIDVSVTPLAGKTIDRRGYQISGDLELKIWYDANDELARIAFDARGATVDYERLTAPSSRAGSGSANAG